MTELPTTWPEIDEAAQKLADAGIQPVAHGSQDWQDGTVFEITVYGMDSALYSQAFFDLDLDLDALQSDGIPGRDWREGVAMMLNGDAGFLFMGDWAVGHYNNNGFKPNVDHLCGRAPTSPASS